MSVLDRVIRVARSVGWTGRAAARFDEHDAGYASVDPRRKEPPMSGAMDKVTGRAKQAAGDLTDNDELEREGEADEAAGKAKDAVDDVKDGVNDAIDNVKDRFDDN
ncbi:MAG: CsbD family protein [Ilumatobacteraceae bacterium]|nr:CsbD family protein [Ilumatobacteraceae bacterium]